jgi:hypothetical protein
VCRLKVVEWLKERQSKRWTAAPATRQLKPSIEMLLDELSRDLLAVDRAAGWPLYIEADPTCFGPLGELHVQEMWAGEGLQAWHTIFNCA